MKWGKIWAGVGMNFDFFLKKYIFPLGILTKLYSAIIELVQFNIDYILSLYYVFIEFLMSIF